MRVNSSVVLALSTETRHRQMWICVCLMMRSLEFYSQTTFKIKRLVCGCTAVQHTSHPLCPATLSSDRPQGRCWAGPPDSPWWKIPGTNDAWRGHPWGSLSVLDSLHRPLTSLELHKKLPLGTPAPPHCWWSLWPCPWSLGPHRLWKEIKQCVWGPWRSSADGVCVCVYDDMFLLTAVAGWDGGVTGLTL